MLENWIEFIAAQLWRISNGTIVMTRFSRLALVAIGLGVCLAADSAMATTLEDLYSSQTIVNGKYEKNRQAGFKRCLDAVLLRVSGDQRLPAKPQMTALRDKAGSFVAGFSYRDRMEGIPNHDDQGTYDRPHNLYCQYKPADIDPVLASLGSRPWLTERHGWQCFWQPSAVSGISRSMPMTSATC